jgi:hypothetical protein
MMAAMTAKTNAVKIFLVFVFTLLTGRLFKIQSLRICRDCGNTCSSKQFAAGVAAPAFIHRFTASALRILKYDQPNQFCSSLTNQTD